MRGGAGPAGRAEGRPGALGAPARGAARELAEGGGAGQAHVQREECISRNTSQKRKEKETNPRKGPRSPLGSKVGLWEPLAARRELALEPVPSGHGAFRVQKDTLRCGLRPARRRAGRPVWEGEQGDSLPLGPTQQAGGPPALQARLLDGRRTLTSSAALTVCPGEQRGRGSAVRS